MFETLCMEAALPRQRWKELRISRPIRRAAKLPRVPVVVPDLDASGTIKPSADQPQSATLPDPVDDRIRRMIEAAYT
ncbi:MAG TPA: hypothetical protein VND19_05245 [Acetobacteraceae bacterium]|nr:hypothetical protein [Acetobacteraceae bacterium]